jgi:hypothetical protein
MSHPKRYKDLMAEKYLKEAIISAFPIAPSFQTFN